MMYTKMSNSFEPSRRNFKYKSFLCLVLALVLLSFISWSLMRKGSSNNLTDNSIIVEPISPVESSSSSFSITYEQRLSAMFSLITPALSPADRDLITTIVSDFKLPLDLVLATMIYFQMNNFNEKYHGYGYFCLKDETMGNDLEQSLVLFTSVVRSYMSEGSEVVDAIVKYAYFNGTNGKDSSALAMEQALLNICKNHL